MRSPVVVVGRFTVKFARDTRGRASNLYEAKLYRNAKPQAANDLSGFEAGSPLRAERVSFSTAKRIWSK
jgi:hypothetical protein